MAPMAPIHPQGYFEREERQDIMWAAPVALMGKRASVVPMLKEHAAAL